MNLLKIEENNLDYDKKNIADILISNGWGKSYEDNNIDRTFKGSSYFAIAKIKNKEIGYIRAISDNISVTFICEVIVHKAYHKKGVARELMRKFNKAHSHTAVYAMSFKDNFDFFSKFGIRKKEKLVSHSRAPLLD